MNKIQLAQLSWSAKKNKENLDLSMQEMGKSLENIITAMASVDPKTTLEILKDISSQVERQSKDITEKLLKEKSKFVEAFLKEHSGTEY